MTKKRKVEDIVLTEEQIEKLKAIENRFIHRSLITERKKIIGHSCCCICSNIPTKKVSIDVSEDGQKASKIETYCKLCFERSGY